MKIGIDARIWSETTGRYVRNLVKELSKIDKSNQYFIFVRSNQKDLVKESIKAQNFKIVPTDIMWHSLKEQVSYAKQIEKYELDLMHFTYFSLPINYSKPFIVTIHDLIIHHFPTGKASTLPSFIYYIKRYAYIYLVQKSADRAWAIITVSDSTKKEIVDHLTVDGSKISVIYEGVEDDLKKRDDRKLIDSPYILYVGNAYPHKNLNRLIEAFNKAKKPNEKLVLVGKDNFFYKRLRKEFEGKIEGLVFFGEASDEELQGLYANSRAFVMPSLMEGFGLPPLEAMANGCPVLASDIPALREICQDAAIYFDPYNISEIADKIKFAFSDESKKSLVQKGENRVKEFSWDKMARQTLKIYESSNSLRSGK